MTASAWSRVRNLDGRPSLALRRVGQDGDVAGDQVAALRRADGVLEREVPHRDRRGGIPGRHRGQCLPHVGGGRSRSLRAPMTARIGSRTFWFLVTVLAERPSSPWASQSRAACADGVMGVTGLGGDAFVELGVQVAELVDDGGLGGAADLAPLAPAVAGVAGVSSPRHRPGQCRWRCGSWQGPRCSKEMPSSPRLRRVVMVAGHPGWGQSVVTTASLAQPLPDPSGHETAAGTILSFKIVLAGGQPHVHGKEKVYGSIP